MRLRRQQYGARLCAKHQPQHALIWFGAVLGLPRAVSPHPGPLPRGEGESHPASFGKSAAGLCERAFEKQKNIQKLLPLPGGEGWGEGERTPIQSCNSRGVKKLSLRSAFTLIELVVVMTLLVTVIALASPSLAGFFRGRALDAEARRFISLTRLGQSRAASEGLPMILWVDATTRTYGLEADSSFVDQDTKAVEYVLDGNLTVEIGAMDSAQSAITSSTLFENTTSTSKRASQPHIRFEPDGGVSASSPESFRLMERDGGSLWVGLSANRLNYEIHSQETQRVTRRR